MSLLQVKPLWYQAREKEQAALAVSAENVEDEAENAKENNDVIEVSEETIEITEE